MYTFQTAHGCRPERLWGRLWHREICGSINILSCFLPLHLFMNSELPGSRGTARKKAIRASLEPLLSPAGMGWPWEFPVAPLHPPAPPPPASAVATQLLLTHKDRDTLSRDKDHSPEALKHSSAARGSGGGLSALHTEPGIPARSLTEC